MAKFLVVVTKTAEVEVDTDDIRAARPDLAALSDGDMAVEWVCDMEGTSEMELDFDRLVTLAAPLPALADFTRAQKAALLCASRGWKVENFEQGDRKGLCIDILSGFMEIPEKERREYTVEGFSTVGNEVCEVFLRSMGKLYVLTLDLIDQAFYQLSVMLIRTVTRDTIQKAYFNNSDEGLTDQQIKWVINQAMVIYANQGDVNHGDESHSGKPLAL